MILPFVLLSFSPVMAQSKACSMPDDGYWQLVTREDAPGAVIVKFYDLDAHLIYQARMTVASGWYQH